MDRIDYIQCPKCLSGNFLPTLDHCTTLLKFEKCNEEYQVGLN